MLAPPAAPVVTSGGRTNRIDRRPDGNHGAIVTSVSTIPNQTTGAALPPLPLVGATPREVRASLHPEYRDAFDRDYQSALVEAGRSLDLAGIHDTLEHWRRRSWITRDRREHRRLVRRAVELLTGDAPPEDESVAVTESRL